MRNRCKKLRKMPWVYWDWESELNDDGIFHSAGKNCAGNTPDSDYCCVTTIDIVRKKSERMLNLTNKVVIEIIQEKEKNIDNIINLESFKINKGIISPHCKYRI